MRPPRFGTESTGLSWWQHGAVRAPGTIRSSIPKEIPIPLRYVVFPIRLHFDSFNVPQERGSGNDYVATQETAQIP